MKVKITRFIGIVLLVLVTLGLGFILSMHVVAMNSGLKGYRGGQQDAFRHTLASAYVARYISPYAVDLFTKVSEQKITSPHDQMDIHNNRIGKEIGIGHQPIYQSVYSKIKTGQINAQDPDVITWLPPERWTDFLD